MSRVQDFLAYIQRKAPKMVTGTLDEQESASGSVENKLLDFSGGRSDKTGSKSKETKTILMLRDRLGVRSRSELLKALRERDPEDIESSLGQAPYPPLDLTINQEKELLELYDHATGVTKTVQFESAGKTVDRHFSDK